MTRILATIVVALVLAPVALADGPMPYAAQNTLGVLSPGGLLRYVAVTGVDGGTTVEAVATHGGAVHATQNLIGAFGTPYVTSPLAGEGLSADGRTLVLGGISTAFPRTHSSFAVFDAPGLQLRDVFALNGDFAFDALSPNGSRLYLIQHIDENDQSRYVVRAYDLRAQRLLPGRIADRTQRSWVMQGYPIAQTSTPGGRWVYTLYGNPGGFPFVHALDTVRGVAHCVGLPWRGSSNAVFNLRLTLHGNALAVHWLSGRPWLRMSTQTWRLSPDRRGGFPWWALAFLVLVPIASLPLLRDRAARRREVVRDAAWSRRRGSWHRRHGRDGRDGRAARAEWRRQVDDARHRARSPSP